MAVFSGQQGRNFRTVRAVIGGQQAAIQKNWVSTVGENINEVERLISENIGCKNAVGLSAGTAALYLAIKLAGEKIYGQPKIGHGVLEGHRAE